MQISLLKTLAQFGSILQDWLFPRLEEELGPLPERHRQLVKVLGLPQHCAIGCKTNSHGRKETWRGYELHLDVADGQIPISCLLTSASLHDSQVAIPLATLTATRVTSLYDLMGSAYDSELIRQHSRGLGHVPIIDSQARRFKPARLMLPHEAKRFRERTAVERVNALLKVEFGGRNVRVRGALKVMAHPMFGILALTTADQILRLST